MISKYTIEEVNKFVKNISGRCLSLEYINAHEKLEWECKLGHTWKTNWNTIQQGSWCPKCADIKASTNWSNKVGNAKKFKKEALVKLQNIAKKNGGKLLSSTYATSKAKLKWRCAEGHEWMADASHTKNGRWCPVCAVKNRITNRTGKTAILKIEDLQKLAKLKGGRLLSSKYERAHQMLKWQCEEGHEWSASAFSIKTEGTWCSVCSQGVSERISRRYLEEIFCEKFPKKRPKWLINGDGNRMELDGFCEPLKIAFEYHGRQHFKEVHYFTKGDKKLFAKRIKDDTTKRGLCKKRGITLVEIPYTVEHGDIGIFVIHKLKKAGISLPKTVEQANLNHESWNIYSPKLINDMKEYATKQDGECLSENYINNSTKLRWRCVEGHVWESSPSNITSGKWCPVCAIERRKGASKYSLTFLLELAESKSGNLISRKFTGLKSDYHWECAKGHEFKTKASTIYYQNTWCPKCATARVSEKLSGVIRSVSTKEKLRKYTIDYLRTFAHGKGGECLSEKFTNSKTKYKWICKSGHEWEQYWYHIKEGVWCPECAGVKKFSVEYANNLAKEFGGRCLSKDYKNTKEKLLWECKKGHQWGTSLTSVQAGHWCPECAGRKHLTIEDMQKLAKTKGGHCLSDKYVNAKTKLEWKCKKGHRWLAIPDSVRRGSWCTIKWRGIYNRTKWY